VKVRSGSAAGAAIVLNGTSSAGKTTLGRALQDRLEGWWLLFGVDTLIAAMPRRLFGTSDGHTIGSDGSIDVGPGWRLAHDHWRMAIGALVRSGGNVVLDEVFLEGAKDQDRWRQTLRGLAVTWVRVSCDIEVAAAREAARHDRMPHMARFQAGLVHDGVRYDVVVDTTVLSPAQAAEAVIAQLNNQ
jgi:chloramphenicol 3-O phosphotransferase